MNVLSSVEFEILAKKVTPKLTALSRAKCDKDPQGFVTLADVDAYIRACSYSGDAKASNWLKNLKLFATNGTLGRIRKGSNTWENHVLEVEVLHRRGEIKFNLGDSVMVKESGKYGQVIDYLPDEKEYVVVLDPFQMATLKPGDLDRVAKIEKEALELQPIGSNMTLLSLEGADILFSYSTPVAYLDKATGEYYRTDESFSVTTSRHINSWLAGADAVEVPQAQIEALVATV